MNILIIEDEEIVALKIYNSFRGYTFSHRIDICNSYEEFLKKIVYILSYDIILTDIDLGSIDDKDGLDIVKIIRKKDLKIPIIIISGYSDYNLLETAFNEKVNDYIIKPFRPRELQIRVERWFRNYVFSQYFSTDSILEYGDILYNLKEYEFYVRSKHIILSRGNKYLLGIFLIHREKLVTQQFLIEKIWGCADKDYKKNIRIKIMRLKKELSKYGLDIYITTVRGEGYIFKKIGD